MVGLKRAPRALAGALIVLGLAGGSVAAQSSGWSAFKFTRLSSTTQASGNYPGAIVAGSCTTADALAAFKRTTSRPRSS